MPYVNQVKRPPLDAGIAGLTQPEAWTSGEVNYVLTRIILLWRPPVRSLYADHQAVLGLLEAIKAEYIEQVLRPYEDKKCIENGKVY